MINLLLDEIAYNNSLELIETTTGKNGYPENLKYAIIGFKNFEQAKEIAKKHDLLITEFRDKGEYISEKEADSIKGLDNFILPGWNGADIYGGGMWIKIKDEDLYLIYNNGRDGDDWSLNNYKTGGAGAIAFKSKGSAKIVQEMKEYIDSVGDLANYLKEIYTAY